jgi:hypothetical protein
MHNEQYKKPLLSLYYDIEEKMKSMPAAVRWHHSEIGGLYRHTKEVIEIALGFYNNLRQDFERRFILEDDVILVAFIHDLEKLDKYKFNNDYDPSMKYTKGYKETQFTFNYDKTDMNDTAQVVRICYEYGLKLKDIHLNSLTYHHGGYSVDTKGSLTPLAALIHSADLISANMFKKP